MRWLKYIFYPSVDHVVPEIPCHNTHLFQSNLHFPNTDEKQQGASFSLKLRNALEPFHECPTVDSRKLKVEDLHSTSTFSFHSCSSFNIGIPYKHICKLSHFDFHMPLESHSYFGSHCNCLVADTFRPFMIYITSDMASIKLGSQIVVLGMLALPRHFVP